MVEWSITAVLKTVDGNIRGFESLSLRQTKKTGFCLFFVCWEDSEKPRFWGFARGVCFLFGIFNNSIAIPTFICYTVTR